MCSQGTRPRGLRGTWRVADDNGRPTGPFISRVAALQHLGGQDSNDWKKVMRFSARRIDEEGRSSDVQVGGKKVSWWTLTKEKKVPQVTVMNASMFAKLNQ